MCTKFFSDGAVHSYFNPYDTPYDAFINYMNVLNDFTLRVNAAVPQTGVEQEISNLTGIINEKEKIISRYEEEIYELNKQILLSGHEQTAVKKTTAPKTTAKKPAAKRPAAKKPSTGQTAAKASPARKTTATGTAKSSTTGKVSGNPKKADAGSGKSAGGTKTGKRKD